MISDFYLLVEVTSLLSEDKLTELAIEIDALDVITNNVNHVVHTKLENFGSNLEFLQKAIGSPEEAFIGWIPVNTINIDSNEKLEKLYRAIEVFEDNEDVQHVFTNLLNPSPNSE